LTHTVDSAEGRLRSNHQGFTGKPSHVLCISLIQAGFIHTTYSFFVRSW